MSAQNPGLERRIGRRERPQIGTGARRCAHARCEPKNGDVYNLTVADLWSRWVGTCCASTRGTGDFSSRALRGDPPQIAWNVAIGAAAAGQVHIAQFARSVLRRVTRSQCVYLDHDVALCCSGAALQRSAAFYRTSSTSVSTGPLGTQPLRLRRRTLPKKRIGTAVAMIAHVTGSTRKIASTDPSASRV